MLTFLSFLIYLILVTFERFGYRFWYHDLLVGTAALVTAATLILGSSGF